MCVTSHSPSYGPLGHLKVDILYCKCNKRITIPNQGWLPTGSIFERKIRGSLESLVHRILVNLQVDTHEGSKTAWKGGAIW